MANFNRVILVGRLTKDPEIRYTPSGAQLAKFGLAVSRFRSKNNETDFFNVVAWQKLAEICGQYLRKGRLVLIEGEIHTRTYETQDGQKRSTFDIKAENMQMLESKKTAQQYDQEQQYAPQGASAPRMNSMAAPPSSGIQDIEVDDLGIDEFDAEDMPF